MTHPFTRQISALLSQLAAESLLKNEHEITSPQSGQVQIEARRMINLCANNYLGLADRASLI